MDHSDDQLNHTRIVLGFAASTADQARLATYDIKQNQVFSIKRRISFQNSLLAPGDSDAVMDSYGEPETNDFAFLELDHPADVKVPYSMELAPESRVGDPIAMIGHPAGLPLKISSGAKIMNDESLLYFGNLDGFHGSSGSPVFNLRTGKVIGIYVTTNIYAEWIYDIAGNCTREGNYGDDYGGDRTDEGIYKLSSAWAKIAPATRSRILGTPQPAIPKDGRGTAKVNRSMILQHNTCGADRTNSTTVGPESLVLILDEKPVYLDGSSNESVRIRVLRNTHTTQLAAAEGCEGYLLSLLLERAKTR